MSIIKVGFKVLVLSAVLASTNTMATDITVGGSTVSIDDRESAGDSDAVGNDNVYNIDQMDVSWSSDNTITVDIFTNFANLSHDGGTETHNNQSSHSYFGRNIMYGDLMIGVDSDSFNYAFNLSENRGIQTGFENSSTGGLYNIENSNTWTSRQWHNNSDGSARRNGIVSANTNGLTEIDANSSWSVSHGKISFSFNVANLDVFRNASTLALSWAETCFNDAVHGEFDIARKNKPADVPEPATIVLMLLALAGVASRQKNKRNSFSA